MALFSCPLYYSKYRKYRSVLPLICTFHHERLTVSIKLHRAFAITAPRFKLWKEITWKDIKLDFLCCELAVLLKNIWKLFNYSVTINLPYSLCLKRFSYICRRWQKFCTSSAHVWFGASWALFVRLSVMRLWQNANITECSAVHYAMLDSIDCTRRFLSVHKTLWYCSDLLLMFKEALVNVKRN